MGGGFLRHIRACNAPVREPFWPWRIDGVTYGWVRPAFARRLADWPDTFRLVGEALESQLEGEVPLQQRLARVAESLAASGELPLLLHEPYPVTAGAREQAVVTVDRALAAPLGLRSFGQHLNGYLQREDGIWMWIARRARDRLIFPGALDNMVAGGLPHGVGLRENLLKECEEEAGMPPELAARARPVSALSYNRVAERGFRPDVLYCYDIELPADFEPRNTDGEVESFTLMPIDRVMRIVRDTDEFKLNCNLVIIDFLVRHGLIGPEDPDYLDIVTGLHPPVGMPETNECND